MYKYLTILQEILVLYGALNNHFSIFGTRLWKIYCFKKLITTILSFGYTSLFNSFVLTDFIYNPDNNKYSYRMFQEEANLFLDSLKVLLNGPVGQNIERVF
jgi:hypothetical protein